VLPAVGGVAACRQSRWQPAREFVDLPTNSQKLGLQPPGSLRRQLLLRRASVTIQPNARPHPAASTFASFRAHVLISVELHGPAAAAAVNATASRNGIELLLTPEAAASCVGGYRGQCWPMRGGNAVAAVAIMVLRASRTGGAARAAAAAAVVPYRVCAGVGSSERRRGPRRGGRGRGRAVAVGVGRDAEETGAAPQAGALV
jgi:hypothetical protein